MEFAKPVKVALGRLEHIAFIKRHLDVYKKPDITHYMVELTSPSKTGLSPVR